MTRNTNRLVAAVTLGVLVGAYIRHDYMKWNRLGREAFIAHQAQRFDMYMATPRPALPTIIGAVLIVIGLVVVYEAIVAVISKISESGESQLT
jgi:tetrahydromethanopterin S-methyltransferase subunit E